MAFTTISTAVITNRLEKSFGPKSVLRNISLSVDLGNVLVLFGPNGAGKSTLLRILSTITRPDSGTATVNGYDIVEQPEQVRRTTGAVLHSPMLYADMTVRENLRFFARLAQVPNVDDRLETAASRMQIDHRLDDRVRLLSRGLAQRAALARAILHEPSLLLLDEPETGLDQSALEILDGLVDEYRSSGRTVVMTTHSLSRGLALADQVAILSRGRLAFSGPRVDLGGQDVSDLYQQHVGAAP